MADAVRISDLPVASSFGPEDVLVVNDITGADEITSTIAVGSFVNWITTQDLKFTGTLEVGNIVPDPVNGFNVTVTSIHVDDKLSIDPFADIEGIELDDLDDVVIDEGLLSHGHTLMWDSQQSAWVNDFLSGANAGDTVKTDFDLLRDSIDTLNDSIELLMDSIDAKLDPAPSDGGYYAMQNGEWVDISESVNKFTKYLIYDGGVDPT